MSDAGPGAHAPHTCPVWVGVLLASPIRRLFENPARLVLPLIAPGFRVLELGPALGFFTLPMARAVRPNGQLFCVDVQPGMLARLRKRLAKRGLLDRTQLRLCSQGDLGLADLRERCDLAVALHVVHETNSPTDTMTALASCLKPGGKLLLVEPPGHCSDELWEQEVAAAEAAGLVRTPHPRAEGRRRLALFARPTGM